MKPIVLDKGSRSGKKAPSLNLILALFVLLLLGFLISKMIYTVATWGAVKVTDVNLFFGITYPEIEQKICLNETCKSVKICTEKYQILAIINILLLVCLVACIFLCIRYLLFWFKKYIRFYQ